MDDMNDRIQGDARKNLRAPLIIQKVHLGEDRTAFFGYMKNISRSGIFIATTNAIEPGEQINLEFQLPAPLKGFVRCRCEVVWKRPIGSHLPFEPGMGLKFLDMPEETSDLIEEWVRKSSN